MFEEIKEQAFNAAGEILKTAGLKEGQILVVGCSSSEVCGDRIGSNSNPEVAEAVFSGIYEAVSARGVYLAAQVVSVLDKVARSPCQKG